MGKPWTIERLRLYPLADKMKPAPAVLEDGPVTGVQREPAADLGVAIIWATLLISGAVMLCCGILAAQHWQAIDVWGDAAAILGAAPWHMYQRAIALTGAGLLAMAAYPWFGTPSLRRFHRVGSIQEAHRASMLSLCSRRSLCPSPRPSRTRYPHGTRYEAAHV